MCPRERTLRQGSGPGCVVGEILPGEGERVRTVGQRKRKGRERGAESSSQALCGGGALALTAQVWPKYDPPSACDPQTLRQPHVKGLLEYIRDVTWLKK